MARKKRVTKQQREDRLRRLLWPWLWWLGIHQRYRVDWCWNAKLEGSRMMKGQADKPRLLAQVYGHYPYRHLHLCLATPVFDEEDDDELEDSLLHELIHADVFWPLRRIINDLADPTVLVNEKGVTPPTLLSARTEYATLEESAVDLLTHWLMRLKPEKGLPLLLKEHVRDQNV